MIGLLLTLAVLPQGTNQARLHPADALVMIEIPDVTKMVTAYEKAPMMAMLHDGDARKSFYGAFEGTDINFDGMLTDALRKMGMPDAFANEPMAGIRHYFDGIGAASFSLSLDRAGLEEFGPHVARMGEIEKQINAITAAIETYQGADKSGASTLPKDLVTLGLDASTTLDPWKHPYEYKVSADGTYVLHSLGADGKPGGSGENADISKADAAKSAEGFIGLLGFQTVIEFKNQIALDELRTILSGLLSKSGMKAARTGPFQLSGVQAELQSWTAPDGQLNGTELWLMRAQNMLVLGGGRSTPEAFATRLADPREQTAAEQFYAGLIKDFGAPSGATIVQGSLRLADYSAAMRKFADAEGSDVEMLDMMDKMLPNASVRMQLVGDRFVTEITTKYAKPSGIIAAALGLAPLPKEILTAVPEDAIGVYVSSIDGPLMWNSLKQGLLKSNDESKPTDEQLKALEERYNFSVEKDIFGSVGKGMLMYFLPLKGLTSLPGSVAMVVDLKDPVAMQRGIEGLISMLGDEAGTEFKIHSKPYHDAPVWTFSFGEESGGGMNPLMASFSPSITIVKNQLIVTLNQNHIKKEIKRAFGEERGAHVITTEGHRPPQDATSFGYMDWAALLNGVYEGGRSAVGLLGGAMPIPVDVAKLPQPGVFTHFFKPTIYYTRSLPNGVYMRNESSFGPEVLLGLVGAGLAVSMVAHDHGKDEVATKSDENEAGEEHGGAENEAAGKESARAKKESAKGAHASAQSTQTSGDLRHVATWLAVYQMDAGKFPASLDTLLLPTKNYPKGFVGQGTLPNDGWGHGFKYTLLEGGARYRLWSLGPDGLDQQGGGDDIVSP